MAASGGHKSAMEKNCFHCKRATGAWESEIFILYLHTVMLLSHTPYITFAFCSKIETLLVYTGYRNLAGAVVLWTMAAGGVIDVAIDNQACDRVAAFFDCAQNAFIRMTLRMLTQQRLHTPTVMTMNLNLEPGRVLSSCVTVDPHASGFNRGPFLGDSLYHIQRPDPVRDFVYKMKSNFRILVDDKRAFGTLDPRRPAVMVMLVQAGVVPQTVTYVLPPIHGFFDGDGDRYLGGRFDENNDRPDALLAMNAESDTGSPPTSPSREGDHDPPPAPESGMADTNPGDSATPVAPVAPNGDTPAPATIPTDAATPIAPTPAAAPATIPTDAATPVAPAVAPHGSSTVEGTTSVHGPAPSGTTVDVAAASPVAPTASGTAPLIADDCLRSVARTRRPWARSTDSVQWGPIPRGATARFFNLHPRPFWQVRIWQCPVSNEESWVRFSLAPGMLGRRPTDGRSCIKLLQCSLYFVLVIFLIPLTGNLYDCAFDILEIWKSDLAAKCKAFSHPYQNRAAFNPAQLQKWFQRWAVIIVHKFHYSSKKMNYNVWSQILPGWSRQSQSGRFEKHKPIPRDLIEFPRAWSEILNTRQPRISGMHR